MRALELFSGTGSIGRAFEDLGWEVVSLDILPGATLTTDILEWDYRSHAPPGHYDFIWASPPCTQYSVARTTARTPRDFEGADNIVRKTLEIVEYFEPPAYLMENPQTGYLKNRPVVAGLEFRDVCYCKYGFPYKKATRFWGFLPTFRPRPMCNRASPCEHVVDGRHPVTAQWDHGFRARDLYRIPPDLCRDVAQAAHHWALMTRP